MIAIARITILEALRRKVLLSAVLMTGAFLALYGFFVSHQAMTTPSGLPTMMREVADLDLGSLFCYFMIAFFAIFSVSGSVSAEIESGILASVLPRPVRRRDVVVGKWLGFALVQVIYVSLVLAALMLIVGAYDPLPGAAHLFSVWACFVLEAWGLSAVTLLGSVLLPTLANGIGLALWYFITFLSGSYAQLPFSQSAAMRQVEFLVALCLPSDGLFRRAVYELASGSLTAVPLNLLGPFGVQQVPSWGYVAYAAGYVPVMLALAVWAFSRRDV
ncbi:MAG: ABC transporter permease [Thermaerobacter sp.]|nr:ABC transporter permease [Thermaerobacter sp.]